ncbi:MAG: Coenzyme F420 hydrogenase/dehydrogenase, beta subunit C-terminal domain [Thermodesulfobacteriota bacterium]
MKTFADLITEVQERGLCHRCGGCVTFCEAVNYGALESDAEGNPRYRDQEKCIECGLCYVICPVINELEKEVKKHVGWEEPLGRIQLITTGRSTDQEIRARATDGGLVTGLLLTLLTRGHIDGAVVSKKTGGFNRQPWLARSGEELLEAAGFHFDTVQGTALFPGIYSTYSPSIITLNQIKATRNRVKRVAFVGTPCQINTMRRMQALGILPSDTVQSYFGLFCSGNFYFREEQRRQLETLGGFRWEDVLKINIKEDLMIHLSNEEVRHLPLEKLNFMKRPACLFCNDYSAEYADLSFGGIGSEEGWTTVIIRNAVGKKVFEDGKVAHIEEIEFGKHAQFSEQALKKILDWSQKKKQQAEAQIRLFGKEDAEKLGFSAPSLPKEEGEILSSK